MSISRFWGYLLEKHSSDLERLSVGECMSFSGESTKTIIEELKRRGLEYRKMPDYVSISVVSKLSKNLRGKLLYPVRLGQWRSGYAEFLICKASKNYERETLSPRHLALRIDENLALDERLTGLFETMRGESIASSIAIYVVSSKLEDRVDLVVPQYRAGRVCFDFMVERSGGIYRYDGQVEIDSIIVAGNRLYAVESKELGINDALFKHQLAFSISTAAQLFLSGGSRRFREVCGVVSLKIRRARRVLVGLTRCIDSVEPVVINDIDVLRVFNTRY